jgi:predicted AlkP superfamily pyrophosphatase or phosphodiesterase
MFSLGLIALACTGQAPPVDTALPPRERRALFFGIDGLRADGPAAADTPNLDRLAAEGAWTLDATTQLTAATVSAPGWTSMSTGVEPEKHGVVANGEYQDRAEGFPTFLWRARHELGLSTGLVSHWPDIIFGIHEPDAFTSSALRTDDGVAEWIVAAIEEDVHDVLYASVDDVDAAGHATGFDPENPDYVAAIEEQDARLGLMLAAIEASEADWLVVVSTDHGGEGTGHGDLTELNRSIPFWVWGAGVVPGELGAGLSHMDVNPTILAYMGLEAQEDWGLDGQARGLMSR